MEKTDQEIPEQKQESFLFSRLENLSKFNQKMTFDKLVIGPSNQSVVDLIEMLIRPTSLFTCLLIIGDIGTGKTHLLQATCQKALSQGLKVLYLSGYGFANLFIKASKEEQLQELMDNLSNLDLLALDDVQTLTLIKETRAQDALLRIIDFLMENQPKLLVSSLDPLEPTKRTYSKLASRFSSDLQISLNSPDTEIKSSILLSQIEKARLQISQEQLDYLTNWPIKDFYSLLSITQNLIARAQLNQDSISDDIIKEVLDAFFTQKEQKDFIQKEQEDFTPDEIMKAVCRAFKVEESCMKSKSRKKGYTLPRQVYIYLCKKLIPWATLDDIGKTINRIHSTVLYSIEIIETKMMRDRALKRKIDFIKEKLEEN